MTSSLKRKKTIFENLTLIHTHTPLSPYPTQYHPKNRKTFINGACCDNRRLKSGNHILAEVLQFLKLRNKIFIKICHFQNLSYCKVGCRSLFWHHKSFIFYVPGVYTESKIDSVITKRIFLTFENSR